MTRWLPTRMDVPHWATCIRIHNAWKHEELWHRRTWSWRRMERTNSQQWHHISRTRKATIQHICVSSATMPWYYSQSIRNRASKGPSKLDNHCLNYLRQIILCNSATEADLFSGLNGRIPIYLMRICNNWSAVYSEVQGNLDQVASRERWIYCFRFCSPWPCLIATIQLANTLLIPSGTIFPPLSSMRLFLWLIMWVKHTKYIHEWSRRVTKRSHRGWW